MSLPDCIIRIRKDIGTHFDPEIADSFFGLLDSDESHEGIITGNWKEPDKFSENYLRFIHLIDLDKIDLCSGDTERIDEIKTLVKHAINNTVNQICWITPES